MDGVPPSKSGLLFSPTTLFNSYARLARRSQHASESKMSGRLSLRAPCGMRKPCQRKVSWRASCGATGYQETTHKVYLIASAQIPSLCNLGEKSQLVRDVFNVYLPGGHKCRQI